MIHILNIPNFMPISTNRLMRLHWAHRNARLKEDRAVIGAHFLQAGIPKALGKRRVSLLQHCRKGKGSDACHRFYSRLADPDNLLKSLLDALATCRAILDDGPTNCELGDLRAEWSDRWECVVTLEDLE
jgi:hypothetical protein